MRPLENRLALLLVVAGVLVASPASVRAHHKAIDPEACYWAEFVDEDGHCVGPTTHMCMGSPDCMIHGNT
jgi:hypothetical protein